MQQTNNLGRQTTGRPPAPPDGTGKTSVCGGGVCQKGSQGGLLAWWEKGRVGNTQAVVQDTRKNHVMCVLHQVGLTCGLAVQTMPLCAWPHRSTKQPLALLQPPVDSRAQACQAQAPLPLPHLGDVSWQAVAVWAHIVDGNLQGILKKSPTNLPTHLPNPPSGPQLLLEVEQLLLQRLLGICSL
jgi:hypothetical protein